MCRRLHLCTVAAMEDTMEALDAPFAPELNPCAEDLERRAIGWGREFQLFPSDRLYQRVCAAKAAYLIAGAYPQASFDALYLVACWNLWLMLWDDVCGAPGLRDQPQ